MGDLSPIGAALRDAVARVCGAGGDALPPLLRGMSS